MVVVRTAATSISTVRPCSSSCFISPLWLASYPGCKRMFQPCLGFRWRKIYMQFRISTHISFDLATSDLFWISRKFFIRFPKKVLHLHPHANLIVELPDAKLLNYLVCLVLQRATLHSKSDAGLLTTAIPVGTANSSLLRMCAGQYQTCPSGELELAGPKWMYPPLPLFSNPPTSDRRNTSATHTHPVKTLITRIIGLLVSGMAAV